MTDSFNYFEDYDRKWNAWNSGCYRYSSIPKRYHLPEKSESEKDFLNKIETKISAASDKTKAEAQAKAHLKRIRKAQKRIESNATFIV